MTLVASREELQNALETRESDIQVNGNFNISAKQTISYAVAITSATGGSYGLTKAVGYDGALFEIQNDGSLNLQNITLDGAKNTHPYNSDSNSLVVVASGTLTLGTGSVLQNNNARIGGAVTCAPAEGADGRVVIQGNTRIYYNIAEEDGGGIYISRTAPGSGLEMSGQVQIVFNHAGGAGAGVYYETDQPDTTLTIRGQVTFDSNNATRGSGGGLFAKGCALELLDRVAFNFNTSLGNHGGGLAWAGSRLEMAQGCRMTTNSCGGNGGGMYLSPTAPANVAIHGTINKCSAELAGGGVYLDAPANGTLDFSNATFTTNEAVSGEGGGGLVLGGSTGSAALTINMQNTSLLDNKSGGAGSGLALVFASAYHLSATGCTFTGNTGNGSGGGIYAYNSDGCTMELRDCTIAGNAGDLGGGLYFSHEGTGESALVMESVTMSDNLGRNGAGAIYLGAGNMTVDLNQVSLSDNLALDGVGGGLQSTGGTGRITIRGGSQIRNNSAASGGGIYHSGDRVLALFDVNFGGNTAVSGLDVYNAGPLTFDPVVELESAMADIRDGLYLRNEEAVPMLYDNLTLDSLIQLERSDYVTPNQTGVPIVVAVSGPPLRGEDALAFRAPTTGFDGWEIRISDGGYEVLLAPVRYAIRYENTLGAVNPNPDSYTALTPTIVLLSLADKPGDRFLGWFDAPEGGTQVTEIPLGSTGDKTLYARWQAVEYTVTYYGNDDDGPSAEDVPPSQRVRGGTNGIDLVMKRTAEHFYLML